MPLAIVRSLVTRSRQSCATRRAIVMVLATATVGATSAPASAAEPTWGPATADDTRAQEYVGGPSVSIDASGTATAVWVRTQGATDAAVVASVRPPGGPWSTPTAISAVGYGLGAPQVEVNADGAAVAVWIDNDRLVGAARPSGGAWQAPQVVGTETPHLYTPGSLAISPQGKAIFVWQVSPFGSARPLRVAVRSAGGSWTEPSEPVQTEQIAFSPAAGFAPDESALLIWDENGSEGAVIRSRALLANDTWGPRTTVSSPNAKRNFDARLAVDRLGNATAVWQIGDFGRNEDSVVAASTRPAGGSWTAPVTISGNVEKSRYPELAVNAAGQAVAIWSQTQFGTTETPVNRAWISTRPGLQSAWDTPVALSPAEFKTEDTRVGLSDAGVAMAAWLQYETAGPETFGPVTLRSASRAPGGTWSTGEARAQGSLRTPDLAISGTGEGVATWFMSGADGPHRFFSAAYEIPRAPTPFPSPVPTPFPSPVPTAVPQATSSPSPAPTAFPPPPSRPAYLPAVLKGNVLTLDALVKPKAGQACPKPSAVTVTLETRTKLPKGKGKKARTKVTLLKVSETKLAVAKVDGACRISGTVTLRNTPSKSQKVLVRITAKTLRGGAAIEATRP